jgi:hypothetical protein
VKIKIKDDIISVPLDSAGSIKDGGLKEFLPRSASGFQDELKFRFESGLPFVTGSLSAHECCAVAANKARRVSAVQRYKERQAEIIEKQFGMECGRTLEVARDTSGRSLWKFFSDPESLFVCTESDAGASWQRFCDSASVASAIVSLEREPCVKDLKEAFPVAAGLIKGGTWSDLLLKKRFPKVTHFMNDDGAEDLDEEGQHDILEVEGGFDVSYIPSLWNIFSSFSHFIPTNHIQPYHVGEHVLVEAKSGQLLWDAIVTGQSKKMKEDSEESLLLDGYRVDYKAWGSRFTEWVKPNRVVEPSENNRLLQVSITRRPSLSKRQSLNPSHHCFNFRKSAWMKWHLRRSDFPLNYIILSPSNIYMYVNERGQKTFCRTSLGLRTLTRKNPPMKKLSL